MDITCIIPVFNRRQLVLEAIKSVLKQECSHDIEIIVVDDGSTDNTPDAVRASFPEVKVIQTEGGLGPGRARNIGAQHASGHVLMFLDSDDQWLPHHAETLYSLLTENSCVSYGITHTTDSSSGEAFLIPDDSSAPSGKCRSHLLRWCFLVPSAVAVRAEAFHKAGGFPHMGFGEDWLFFMRLSRTSEFAFAPEIITKRLLHRESLCASENIRAKIAAMLKSFYMEALEESDQTAYQRFLTLYRHATSAGEKWNTVQDWYMSLRKHGLV